MKAARFGSFVRDRLSSPTQCEGRRSASPSVERSSPRREAAVTSVAIERGNNDKQVTMSPPKRLTMKIKRYREQRGLSQEALSKKAGLSREYLARLEGGQHNPSLVTLQKLAKALGVPVTELLG